MSFLLVPSKLFSSLSASDKHAVGHILSHKPVVPCGHIVVSSLHCGCSKPGLNPGQDSILLSGSGNMTLLFATSSYSWIFCLKLTGVLCCLPAAKTSGWLQTEVVAQNHGKCPSATYFMPKTELSETDVRDLGNLQCCGFPGSASKNPPPQDEMKQPALASLGC